LRTPSPQGEGWGEAKIKNMNKKSTPLVDEHLQSIQGMREAGTDDFFYTRLKATMLNRQAAGQRRDWQFPLKPVWVIGTLVLLLTLNGFMLSQRIKTKTKQSVVSSSSLQTFAESYDQAITTSY